MKIIHTSDWHLGRLLYSHKRYEEFEAFLNWLHDLIEKEKIDCLLVAGDIFDTNTPSNRAQEMYFKFLTRVAESKCRHVVVIGGNHDSPTLLEAPKSVLKFLNVHVVGAMSENIEDELIELKNENNELELLICAVPYLRDKDVRKTSMGQSHDDKHNDLMRGIKEHYAELTQLAVNKNVNNSPIIGMGHLFTSGGKTHDDDGVRDLYVGTLANLGADTFSEDLDYVALGHLHIPQIVSKQNRIRYCGSPLPMGFGEAEQQKQVNMIEFNGRTPEVKEVHIPRFQRLKQISGTWNEIKKSIEILKEENERIYIEIDYENSENKPTFNQELDELIENSQLKVLRLRVKEFLKTTTKRQHIGESLSDLNEYDVFNRRLSYLDYEDKEKEELIQTYKELLHIRDTKDINAE